jgi:hypothetical protein
MKSRRNRRHKARSFQLEPVPGQPPQQRSEAEAARVAALLDSLQPKKERSATA